MSPPDHPDAPKTGPDPSMEDILASIRRILNEDEAPPSVQPAMLSAPVPPAAKPPPAEDVLVLDSSMMVPEPPQPAQPQAAQREPPRPDRPQPDPPQPALATPAASLIGPETAASATTAVNALMQALITERATAIHRAGPTIEDLVREEIRPLLKAWLDTHLPPLVERLVRIEIERVVGRAAP